MALSPREVAHRFNTANVEMMRQIEDFIDTTLTENYNPPHAITISRARILSITECNGGGDKSALIEDTLNRFRYVGWIVTTQTDRDGTYYQFEHKR